MTQNSIFNNIKMAFAILIFVGIIYPTKYIIHPFLKIIYTNIYMLTILFLCWVIGILCDGYENLGIVLKEKLQNHIADYIWISDPITSIFEYNITIINIIIISMGILLVYKILTQIHEMWGTIKTILGHILMISLWSWYTLIGDKVNSTLCLRSDNEKRSIVIFYILIITVIIGIISLKFLISTTCTDIILTAFNTSIANKTFTNSGMGSMEVTIGLDTIQELI